MEKPGGALQISTPESQGMASDCLARLHDMLKDRKCAIRSFMVARGEHIVFEHRRHDIAADAPQAVNSVTKSVVGILVGIALRQGTIGHLQQPISDYLPEALGPDMAPEARAITLHHLLTMTSGFAWNERQADPCLLRRCERFEHSGRLHFILSRKMAHVPGAHFEYDSYAAHLLTIILARALGCHIQDYAQTMLFDPLGIARPQWDTDESGIPFGGRGLMLTGQDMLKLGLLMLRNGLWKGERILAPDYASASVRASSTGSLPLDGSDTGYGYLWWTDRSRVDEPPYFAAGYGEQLILVEPKLDLVAAVTANHTRARKRVRELWSEYVCGAVPGWVAQ